MYIIQLLDWYSASISVIAICIVELIMVAWIYGVDNFARDVGFMTGHQPGIGWRMCWKYVTPTILIVRLFCTDNNRVTFFPNPPLPRKAPLHHHHCIQHARELRRLGLSDVGHHVRLVDCHRFDDLHSAVCHIQSGHRRRIVTAAIHQCALIGRPAAGQSAISPRVRKDCYRSESNGRRVATTERWSIFRAYAMNRVFVLGE